MCLDCQNESFMSQNTANNKDSFDIDFSDLLVQEMPLDNTKTEVLDTGGLSAEDLSFLESLSQTPASTAPTAGVQNLETKNVETPKSEVPQETSKTVLHPSLTDPKTPNPTPNDSMSGNKDGANKGAEDIFAAPAPKKSALFGAKDKGKDKSKGKKDADVFSKAPQKTKLTVKKQDLNKPIVLILGVMGVILVLGLLWVFMGKSEEPTPVPEPTPVETQAPTPEPTPEVAPETSEAPAETAGATAENADTPAPTGDFTPIDADAIVQAEIPDDPTLIKEEIDRLADENSRLLDQAKDIDGILSDTEKLTAAKEEQIALLEAQIAQLEAQKGK